MIDSSQISWREPWKAVSAEYARHAETELQRELCDSHVLFGRPVTAIGGRQDCDDVLFYLGPDAPRLAVVHLTYSSEASPEFPRTILFETFDAWIEQSMVPDAEDFACDPSE